MTDKYMTATEVQVRMKESLKRFPTPNFNGIINDIARRLRRIALQDALQGSSQDRLNYCFGRATAKPITDLACYGTAVYDPNKLSELAIRWFIRLERLARGKTKC
jgi:hypothetical protein